ncbi:MAG: LAGLIDADG family homing endonuclease [Nitrospiraceae bacterium]
MPRTRTTSTNRTAGKTPASRPTSASARADRFPDLSEHARTVLQARYLVKNSEGTVIETPDGMFRRVAENIAQAERHYGSGRRTTAERTLAERFYGIMRRLEFLPNSPTLMNAGGPLQQLAACFVLPVEDSLPSIYDSLKHQALIHQSGGGTGFTFTHLRPKDDLVASTHGIASGPLSFMRIFNASTDAIKQGGTRRGANMGILRIDHPDILDFIQAKRRPTELTNFNLSVGLTDDFMRRLARGARQPLVNPHTGKTMRQVPAQELFDALVDAAWSSGEPGVLFLDTIERAQPTPALGPIEATNPCVTGDTWVHTTDGPRQVNDLVGRQFGAMVNGAEYLSGYDGFFPTGHSPVVTLRTREGYTMTLTPNHRLQRVIRKTRTTLTSEWTPVSSLSPDDEVVLHNHGETLDWPGPHTFEEGYLLGLLVGDGTLKKDKAVLSVWNRAGAGVHGVMQAAVTCAHTLRHRADFSGWIPVTSRHEHRLALGTLRTLAAQCGMRPGHKTITPEIEQSSSHCHRGFLRGLFDVDGSVQGSQQKGVSVRLAQSDRTFLEAAQRMLLRLGIASKLYAHRRPAGYRRMPDGAGGRRSYWTRENHELTISGSNLQRFQQQIGFADTAKHDKLSQALSSYRRVLNRERFTARVETIVDAGTTDTFDVQVAGIHTFDANGFFAHNCGEQPLLPYESCVLGSINLAKFVTVRDGVAAVDFERLDRLIPDAVRFLDNLIDMSRYPLPAIETLTRGNRKIGLGVMGFADLLIALGLPYDSEDAVALGRTLMQHIRTRAHAVSTALATERGLFPNFSRSRLRAEGQRRRNACVTTVAPTGTISLIADCSAGIEPLYGVSYTRTGLEGTRFTSVHPEFLRRVRSLGLWSDSLAREIASHESIQHLERLPSDLRRLFVTAHDIAPAYHVRMQAAFQAGSDSGVSKTINLPPHATRADVAAAYLLAYRLGCKGVTVYRSGSREAQVLSCAITQTC